MDLKLSGFYSLSSFPTTDQAFGLCYAMKKQRMLSAGKRSLHPKFRLPKSLWFQADDPLEKLVF